MNLQGIELEIGCLRCGGMSVDADVQLRIPGGCWLWAQTSCQVREWVRSLLACHVSWKGPPTGKYKGKNLVIIKVISTRISIQHSKL